MAMRRKVLVSGYRRDGVLHVEVEGAIIKIKEGDLIGISGNKLTQIDIHANPEWTLTGSINNRVIKD